jgi:tellurite resistance protein TerC
LELASVGAPALWIGFTVFVLAMLAIDLGVFHRQAREVSLREAAGWSTLWLVLALAFGAGVTHQFGSERGLEFLTGYLIEATLAVDNILVFYAVFAYFSVPAAYQHRVLFWGVLGALVMRAIFIFLGAVLIQQFHWVIYVFGAILVATAVKLAWMGDEGIHPDRNPLYRLMRRFVPLVTAYHGSAFTVVQNGRRYATPLLVALVLIEGADLVFAVDSIPAIFAITTDPFIIYTSNVFAILGLRSMFFLLSARPGSSGSRLALAVVLAFVGAKMILIDLVKVPIGISLALVAGVIASGVVGSLVFPRRADAPRSAPGTAAPPTS